MKLTVVGKDGLRKEIKPVPAEFVVGREAPAQVI